VQSSYHRVGMSWCHLAAKNFLLTCCLNCRDISFLLGRHMALVVGWFTVRNVFFFVFSFSSPRNSLQPFKILELPFYLLHFNFDLYSFISAIQNFRVILLFIAFQFWSLFFYFNFFVLNLFVKFSFVFNFIIQS